MPVTPSSTEPPRVLDAYAELTAREAEVLALIADGWSNREVSERLVVTVRTVESHIWSILMKFGVSPDDRVNRRVLLARLWLLRPAQSGAAPAQLAA